MGGSTAVSLAVMHWILVCRARTSNLSNLTRLARSYRPVFLSFAKPQNSSAFLQALQVPCGLNLFLLLLPSSASFFLPLRKPPRQRDPPQQDPSRVPRVQASAVPKHQTTLSRDTPKRGGASPSDTQHRPTNGLTRVPRLALPGTCQRLRANRFVCLHDTTSLPLSLLSAAVIVGVTPAAASPVSSHPSVTTPSLCRPVCHTLYDTPDPLGRARSVPVSRASGALRVSLPLQPFWQRSDHRLQQLLGCCR